MIPGKFFVNAAPLVELVERRSIFRGTVLQAGGHLGAVPIGLSKIFDRVITFEVAEDNYNHLVEEVGPNVTASFGALGDGNPIAIHRGKYTATHRAQGPGNIPCYRIDDLGLDLDAILLDVEGGELVALQHATETLRRRKPMVIVEENHLMRYFNRKPGDVERFLAEFGYKRVDAVGMDLVFEVEVR